MKTEQCLWHCILRNGNWRDNLGAFLMTHGRERSDWGTLENLPLCSEKNMDMEGEHERHRSWTGAQSTRSHDNSHADRVSCMRLEQHPPGALLPGRKVLLGFVLYLYHVHTPWSLEAENTCELEGGGTTSLLQKTSKTKEQLFLPNY